MTTITEEEKFKIFQDKIDGIIECFKYTSFVMKGLIDVTILLKQARIVDYNKYVEVVDMILMYGELISKTTVLFTVTFASVFQDFNKNNPDPIDEIFNKINRENFNLN